VVAVHPVLSVGLSEPKELLPEMLLQMPSLPPLPARLSKDS